MSLFQRSLETLDWPQVRDALAARARTRAGARAAADVVLLEDAERIREAHDLIDEVLAVEADGSRIPVGAVGDIGELVSRARRGEALELAELNAAGQALEAMELLQAWMRDHGELAPGLLELAEQIQLDGGLVDRMVTSFDETGQLSEVTYPQLARLKQQLSSLRSEIERTLQGLLQEEGFSDLLQDRYVTQRSDRYVLPIKSHAKRWDLGIVHGTSATGQTVYIEPHQVVALSNRLRVAEGELEREVRRLVAALCTLLGQHQASIAAALAAAGSIDLACARSQLAEDLACTRPHVGEQGILRLHAARHPALLLNGVDVVPNDLSLGERAAGLVLTGPNTGGKTVALKTIGLCALLVRAGCWVPAAEGSRVDVFPILLADIGDTQTVSEGLSTFSGHVAVLRQMLAAADDGALLLLDEVAVGTDPAQGAALARAVLETLVDRGARVIATTHYAELKAMPAVDERFDVGAVTSIDGTPTYKLTRGLAGESHALVIAAGLGLDTAIIDRARTLMSRATRDLAAALAQVDDERGRMEQARMELEHQQQALARERTALETRQARLEAREAAVEAQAVGRFQDRLHAAQQAIGQVVAELQRAPSHQGVQQARATLEALEGLVPSRPAAPAPTDAPPSLAIGDTVTVRSLGKQGTVEGLGGGGAQVRVGAMRMKLPLEDLERTHKSKPRRGRTAKPKPRLAPPAPSKPRSLDEAVRLPHNTLDLRGQRVEEGLEAVESYISQAAAEGHDAFFVLHGHGTGALKQAVRRSLPSQPLVRRFQAASADQGGDAYTVVGLVRG